MRSQLGRYLIDVCSRLCTCVRIPLGCVVPRMQYGALGFQARPGKFELNPDQQNVPFPSPTSAVHTGGHTLTLGARLQIVQILFCRPYADHLIRLWQTLKPVPQKKIDEIEARNKTRWNSSS